MSAMVGRERASSAYTYDRDSIQGERLQKATARLSELGAMKYEDQAIHFLNAYWNEPSMKVSTKPEILEKVYQCCLLMEKLDKKNGKAGNKLGEFESHMFLEKTEGALSSQEMREALASIDLNFDKQTSLMEFLIYIFQIKNWPYIAEFVGGVSAEAAAAVTEAKEGLAKAQAALEEAKAQSDKSHTAHDAAVAAKEEADAKKTQAEEEDALSKKAHDELVAAQEEAQKALEELEAEVKAKAEKIEEQRALSEDETLSTVKRNRAKAMLQILEKEDTQPIRTAKISQEAAVRKVDKATKKAKKTKEDAEAANVASAAAAEEAAKTKTEAEAAAVDADAAVEASDAALTAANEMLDAAVAQCNGQDSESSGQEGSFWWMDRQFEDAKKYMSKKQIAKMEAQRAARAEAAASS